MADGQTDIRKITFVELIGRSIKTRQLYLYCTSKLMSAQSSTFDVNQIKVITATALVEDHVARWFIFDLLLLIESKLSWDKPYQKLFYLFVIAKYSARRTSIVLFISHWVVKCLPHRTFWGAHLVIWFYHVRKRIFIDLKFSWGFEVHTKRLVYIYMSWLFATLSAPSYNPNCLMCMYSNAASLLNPSILSPKESERVYKQKQENPT